MESDEYPGTRVPLRWLTRTCTRSNINLYTSSQGMCMPQDNGNIPISSLHIQRFIIPSSMNGLSLIVSQAFHRFSSLLLSTHLHLLFVHRHHSLQFLSSPSPLPPIPHAPPSPSSPTLPSSSPSPPPPQTAPKTPLASRPHGPHSWPTPPRHQTAHAAWRNSLLSLLSLWL